MAPITGSLSAGIVSDTVRMMLCVALMFTYALQVCVDCVYIVYDVVVGLLCCMPL